MRIALHTATFPDETLTMTPLNVGYLYSYLKKNLEVPNIQLRLVKDIGEAIRFSPDVIGISAVSHVIGEARNFVTACKTAFPDCLAILGGYHITAMPLSLPAEFDIGVLSEGEETLTEVLYALAQNGLSREHLRQIQGIVFHDDPHPCITAKRVNQAELDTIPHPYRTPKLVETAPIFTSRGCPYRCTFCASPIFWGEGAYRLRGAQSVLDEMAAIAANPKTKEIAILDDLWTANKKRFREIAHGIVKQGINEKVTFRGFCRSNMVTKEDVILMKQMNYRYLRFGAETGSDTLLKALKGSSASIEHHQRLIDDCADLDMPCAGSFMFGTPGETTDDLEHTFRFLQRNRDKLKICGLYLFNPVPGTALWEQLLERGRVQSDLPWHEFQMDMAKKDFRWGDFHYWNEENVPREVLREYIARIKADFLPPPPHRKQADKVVEDRSRESSPYRWRNNGTVLHEAATEPNSC